MTKISGQKDQILTVLVLDDMPRWRRILKSMLKGESRAVVVAVTGEEALDILNLRSIDVVVSDLNMPGMNGIQFLQRAKPLFPNTKFVMMSSDSLTCETMSEEFIARGAFAVVAKGEIDPTLVNLIGSLKKPS